MESVHLCSVLLFSADTAAPKKHYKGGESHFPGGLTGIGGTEPYCSRYVSVVLGSLMLMEGFEIYNNLVK